VFGVRNGGEEEKQEGDQAVAAGHGGRLMSAGAGGTREVWEVKKLDALVISGFRHGLSCQSEFESQNFSNHEHTCNHC